MTHAWESPGSYGVNFETDHLAKINLWVHHKMEINTFLFQLQGQCLKNYKVEDLILFSVLVDKHGN